jgi:hypothetical protein
LFLQVPVLTPNLASIACTPSLKAETVGPKIGYRRNLIKALFFSL